MKQKILWISAPVPYDGVAHAGGKIHNYYLKYLKKQKEFDLKLISFYWEREKDKIDLDQYGIDAILLKRAIWELPRLFVNIESVLNPFNRYAGINQNYTVIQLRNALKKLNKVNYVPDIIILQWTEMLVLLPMINKNYPQAKVIGIEEDVKFLNYQRACQNENNAWLKIIKKIKYQKLLQIELDACQQSDYIILNNVKDQKLLQDKGKSSIMSTPNQKTPHCCRV